MSPTDINTSAVIEFAVGHLKVKHVVLCGHSGCDGAKWALSESRAGGVLDTWLTPLRAVRLQADSELASLRDEKSKEDAISEKNIHAGVLALLANHTIQEHVKSRGLQVHGCFFEIASGRVRDLGIGTTQRSKASTMGGEDIVRGRHAQLVFRDGGSAGMAAR